MGARLATVRLGAGYDTRAPDGSEIRLLPALAGAGMAHCTLHAGAVSKAVTHRSVEEIWYVVSGRGQVWRKLGAHEEVVDVEAGVGLTIRRAPISSSGPVGPSRLSSSSLPSRHGRAPTRRCGWRTTGRPDSWQRRRIIR